MQGTVNLAKNPLGSLAGELIGPRGDLLRGHSANVLYVSLYRESNAAFSTSQRSFLVWGSVVITGTDNW